MIVISGPGEGIRPQSVRRNLESNKRSCLSYDCDYAWHACLRPWSGRREQRFLLVWGRSDAEAGWWGLVKWEQRLEDTHARTSPGRIAFRP